MEEERKAGKLHPITVDEVEGRPDSRSLRGIDADLKRRCSAGGRKKCWESGGKKKRERKKAKSGRGHQSPQLRRKSLCPVTYLQCPRPSSATLPPSSRCRNPSPR